MLKKELSPTTGKEVASGFGMAMISKMFAINNNASENSELNEVE